MRILFLTQIVPYPPDAGPRVKTWHVLRYLHEQGHDVTLASFVRSDEEKYLPVLRELCSEVYSIPIHRSRLLDLGYGIKSYLSGRPFLIERDDSAQMRQLVMEHVSKKLVDIIHCDQFTMAQFALDFINGDPLTVFDAHNAVWTIVDRTQKNAPWFLKIPLRIETKRVKQYEARVIKNFSHTLAVTEIDRQLLLKTLPIREAEEVQRKITIIPIAVDTTAQQPVSRKPESMNILTLGTLHYPPNADGIRWFLQEVFPLIQQRSQSVRLTIVGKNPPIDFVQAATLQPDSIQVTGYVEDLLPYLENSALMVVPVRAGGGMRVRILEAFAYGIPVVTTTIGLEGIEASPGDDILVADSAEQFAEATFQLLTDSNLQEKLARNGRNLVKTSYDWQVVLKRMDEIYKAVQQ